jgi:pyruvate dehydrogenase E1 component alpha subunit
MQPLAPDDAVVATYREHGHALVRGGGLPLAVGLALADKMAKRPHVTVCFFGEGAMAEGEFHECLNLSALWKLPVAFYCENNLYAMATALGRSESETDLCLKASSHEIPAWPVDGMDVEACEDAAQRALAVVRAGGGPVFLEFRTYRFRPHSMFDPQLYRARHEFEEWKKRDPIQIYSARLQQSGLLNHDMRSRNWSCAN